MNKVESIIMISGLTAIFGAVIINQLVLIGVIGLIPFALIILFFLIKKPTIGIFLIFILNYYIMPIFRYTNGSGLSVLMDITFVFILIVIGINHIYMQNIQWRQVSNNILYFTFFWMAFCIIEILNPYGIFSAWMSTRMLVFHTFISVLITSILCNKFKIVKRLIFLLSLLTITAIIKVLIQKYIGFDSYERMWLNNGGARTHIIWSGIRYFSFFTDASNFGSNMGFSGAIFIIISIYERNRFLQVYYFFLSLLSIYAMFLSGTRGAMVIPLAALALYCVTSKNIKMILTIGSLLVIVYIFFAFTSIGEGNAQIRRMRTAFHPTEDASFMVRQNNRAKLALYMKDKPFGVGLGMAGGNAQKYSNAYAATIATDSWFVMIWVQMGVVGLTFYLFMLLYGVIYGAYIVMFKIRDKEVKGTLTALLCGTFGLLGSGYTTDSFGQFPCHIMTFIFLTICMKGELYQNEIELNKLNYTYESE